MKNWKTGFLSTIIVCWILNPVTLVYAGTPCGDAAEAEFGLRNIVGARCIETKSGYACDAKNPDDADVNTLVTSAPSDACPSGQLCCADLEGDASAVTTAPASSGAPSVAKIKLQNPLGANVGLFEIMGRVVKAFLGFVGALALMIFIYAGVSYMTAGGEASRVTKARDIMKYAIIGLALIVFAYAFVAFFLEAVTGQKF